MSLSSVDPISRREEEKYQIDELLAVPCFNITNQCDVVSREFKFCYKTRHSLCNQRTHQKRYQ